MKREVRQLIDRVIKVRQEQINTIEEHIVARLRDDIVIAKRVKTGELSLKHLQATFIKSSEMMEDVFNRIKGGTDDEADD